MYDCLSNIDIDGLVNTHLRDPDRVCDADLFYLARTRSESQAFISTIQAAAAEFGRAIFPIHVRHHWCLGIYYPSENRFIVVDSAPNACSRQDILRLLPSLKLPSPSFTTWGQQLRNSNECGLFTARAAILAAALPEKIICDIEPYTEHVSLKHWRDAWAANDWSQATSELLSFAQLLTGVCSGVDGNRTRIDRRRDGCIRKQLSSALRTLTVTAGAAAKPSVPAATRDAAVSLPSSELRSGAAVSSPPSDAVSGAAVSPPPSSERHSGAAASPPPSSERHSGAAVSPPPSSERHSGAAASPPPSSERHSGAAVSPPPSSESGAAARLPPSDAVSGAAVSPPPSDGHSGAAIPAPAPSGGAGESRDDAIDADDLPDYTAPRKLSEREVAFAQPLLPSVTRALGINQELRLPPPAVLKLESQGAKFIGDGTIDAALTQLHERARTLRSCQVVRPTELLGWAQDDYFTGEQLRGAEIIVAIANLDNVHFVLFVAGPSASWSPIR